MWFIIVMPAPVDLSFLVVNTEKRELLLRSIASIFETIPPGITTEVIVLDNCSQDGSADAAADRFGERIEIVAKERRQGKAESDTELLERARGQFCLLMNEDTELRPGAVAALVAALRADPRAAVAAPQLLDSQGNPTPCAWRFPGVGTALAGALFLHRRLTVQSRGAVTREVDWAQSSAMLVRREANEAVGGLDPDFFVYSDEVDYQKRLRDAGFTVLFVPEAEVIHHEALRGPFSPRRVTEFHRNRDLYMTKHHGRAAALVVRLLTAWAYLARAAASLALRRADAARHLFHARRAFRPGTGPGIRESAAELNARLDTRAPGR